MHPSVKIYMCSCVSLRTVSVCPCESFCVTYILMFAVYFGPYLGCLKLYKKKKKRKIPLQQEYVISSQNLICTVFLLLPQDSKSKIK